MFPVFSLPLLSVDGTTRSDITIKTSAMPKLDEGYIEVLITNDTSHPLTISPELKNSFPPEQGIAPKCVYVCMLFSKKADTRAFSMEEMDSYSGTISGVKPLPVEILPAETQSIKLFPAKYLIKMAKVQNEFKLLIDCDSSEISSITLKNVNGVWKSY